ncbi:hypothetical protein BJY04DRAFT_179641 [Aspergillus karnatakaensis]|uniref:ubiquinone-binding COQ10-like protein n=1 Tax=Aspergillus karnatakaensis TaxID=1810916 RepID=UPI003CCD0C17
MSRMLSRRLPSGIPNPALRSKPSQCRARTYYTTLQQQQSQPTRLSKSSPQPIHTQKRTFLSSLLGNNSNSSPNNNGNNTRTLTATRTLPYPPAPLFKTISSVESYSSFLPFLTASTVTARDPETGYPTQAYLTVGYGPLSETFTSKVDCDDKKWVVEARSGEKFVDPNGSQKAAGAGAGSGSGLGGLSSLGALAGVKFPGADEGIFEFLSTRWELVPEVPAGGNGNGGAQTTVKLEIKFEFKNPLYASMMSAVEGQMAGIMIEAFERRVREVNR